jgi:hypothetical protein
MLPTGTRIGPYEVIGLIGMPLPQRPASPGPFGAVAMAISPAGTVALSPFEASSRSLVRVRSNGSSATLPVAPLAALRHSFDESPL